MPDHMDHVHLVGVFCPGCGQYAQPMALEAGPQLVRHSALRLENGARRTCRTQFVAIPHATEARVETIPVSGRLEAETVLRSSTARWLAQLMAILESA